MSPPTCHVPIPGTCENVVHGQRDFTGVTKFSIRSWCVGGCYPGLFRWVPCSHKGPYCKREEVRAREGSVDTEAEGT